MRRRILSNIQHVVAAPDDELTGLQKRLRYVFELVSHCRGELIRVRAEGMAAELTYRTIFSLIPVVVLALIMFRIVGGVEEVQASVENQLYSFFGVPDIPDEYGEEDEATPAVETPRDFSSTYQPLSRKLDELASPLISESNIDTVASPEPDTNDESVVLQDESADLPTNDIGKRQVRASIRRALQEATEKVSSIDFASIGVVGLALFIYTAVTLANAVEHLFNIVYEAPSERPVHIRLAIHWSIITLGGGLLMMSLYMSSQFLDYMGDVVGGSNFHRLLNHSLSLLASWILLFLVYALMPNTQVSIRAAGVGALVSALLWEAAKFAFQIYVAKAVPYSALYGSLGLIPLFLFWIYVTWMIVLFGLILTRTLQTLHGRSPTRLRVATEHLPNGDPDWMVPIMAEVATAFAGGHAIDQQEIVERLQLPGTIVHPMLCRLEHAGLVCRVAMSSGREDRVTLARPAESIRVAEILAVAHHRPDGMNDPRWSLLDQLNDAQAVAAGNRTLAGLDQLRVDPVGAARRESNELDQR
jgi:membrane protein